MHAVHALLIRAIVTPLILAGDVWLVARIVSTFLR